MSARMDVGLRLAGAGMSEQRVIQGDQERGSLAGAGLRLAGDIPAGKRDRQRLGLDRSAVGEPGVVNALQDGRGQAEAVEGGRVWISHQ